MIGYVILILLVLIGIYLIVQYNSLIKANNIVKEAFSTMDVYLKKRWDLVPNLVESVKGYESHEGKTLEKLTSLRSNAYDNLTMDKKIDVNEEVSQGLASIFAVSENYPDLKASENFRQLSSSLTKIEDDIANSRKYYNGTVRAYNTKVQAFPCNIVSAIFKFKPAKLFETKDKANVDVNL